MILPKNRNEYQWNTIEDHNMNLCSYAHLIFEKDTKNIQWRKDNLFKNVVGETG
jgi:hypothetical protein